MNTLKNAVKALASRTHAGNVALSLAALVLALLIVTIAGRPLLPDAVARGLVAQAGDYTALTVDGGNEEILVVLDGRTEQVFVYKVMNQTSVQIFQREDLARIFADARASSRGNP